MSSGKKMLAAGRENGSADEERRQFEESKAVTN